jgi:hypothetical protein
MTKIMNALIEPHYLPSLEFFCAILSSESIVLEKNETFLKQTYRNRCYINTAQGIKFLTVPLEGRHGKILFKDVHVERGSRWRNNHWRTIESAYRKAPFYDYYERELYEIIFRGHERLFELNHDLLSFCLRSIGIKKNISASVAYEVEVEKDVFDLRSQITDKKPFASRTIYRPSSYYQVFGNEFVPNLSLIDLLFCEGPESLAKLKSSSISLNK